MISYLKKTALICFSYLPSPIKLGFYRLMGAQIGSGVSLGFGSYILPYYSGFDKIRIGENTMIGDNVRIRAKELNLGRDVVIKEGTEISGEKGLTMGDDTYIDKRVIVNLRRDIEIGNESGIGANSSLYTHGVWLSSLDGAPVKFGKIIIKNRVWIAAGVFIMPGITIGENAIIGSCSVITKNIAENTIVAGNPAKEIRKYEPAKKPSLEEKQKICRGMVDEYIDRFGEKIKNLKKQDNCISFEITFEKNILLFLKKKETQKIVYLKEASVDALDKVEGKEDSTLIISLLYGDGVKKKIKDHGIMWVDLEERTHSEISGTAANLFIKSLGNNGLKLKQI